MSEFVIKIQAPELAKAITTLALALSGSKEVAVTEIVEANEVVQKEVKAKVEQPKKEVKKVESKKIEKVKEEPKEESKFTEVEVRAKFVELAQAGKRGELKAMLDKFGVAKVSELKEEDYASAMTQLGEM